MFKTIIPVAGGLGAFGVYTAIHGTCLDVYKDVVQLYQRGFPVNVPPYVEERTQQALKDTNVKNPEKFSFCYSFGQSMRHFGSTSISNVMIACPFNFGCQSRMDIDVSKIKLPQVATNIDWDTPEGNAFVKSLIVSEDAQKFAFAEKILYTSTPYPLIFGALAGVFVSLATTLNIRAHSLWNLKAKSRLARFNVAAVITGSSLFLYLCLKDTIHCKLEQKSLEKAMNLNETYLKGGLEYYRMVQIRNQSLNLLLEGNLYTQKGNVKSWIRTANMPISQKVDILTEALNKLATSKEV